MNDSENNVTTDDVITNDTDTNNIITNNADTDDTGTNNTGTNDAVTNNADIDSADTNKPDRKNLQLSRHIIQLISFFLFPGLFITLYSSIKDIVIKTVNGNFSLTGLSSQLLLSIGILFVTILWGRFFCGYLCSFGAMGDLIHAISKRLIPKGFAVPDSVDRILKWLKYFVLAFLVIGVWILSLPVAVSLSPWNAFAGLTSGHYHTAVSVITTIGFILLLAIIAGSFFVERFFCRYLCPLGAIFTPISKKRLYTIKRKEENCNSCSLCSRHCSMGIHLHEIDKVTSGECINCMNCISACPKECFSGNPNPAVAGTATSIALAGLVAAGQILPSTSMAKTNTPVEANEGFENGHGGAGRGQNGFHRKHDGNFNERSDGRNNGDGNFNGNPDRRNNEDGNFNNNPGRNFNKEHGNRNDSKNDNSNSNDKQKPFNKDNNTEDKNNSEKNNSSEKDSEKSTSLDLSKISDGTYTGTGNGFRGTIKTSVTVKSHKITDITIESYTDDDQYFNRAKSQVIDSILSSQTLDVSTVSGATFSSNGILESAADALGVDFTNTNPSGRGKHQHGENA